MNILIISAGLPPLRTGGLPAYVEELIEELCSRGHSIHYLNPCGRDSKKPAIYFRTEEGRYRHTVIYNQRLVPDFGRGTLEPVRQVVPEPAFSRGLDQLINSYRPDVVHIQELIGFPVNLLQSFKRRGIPILFTVHDYYALCPTIKLMLQTGKQCHLLADQLTCDRCCRNGISYAERRAHELSVRVGEVRPLGSILARIVRPTLRWLARASCRWECRRVQYRDRRTAFLKSLAQMNRVICISEAVARVIMELTDCDNFCVEYLSRRSILSEPLPDARIEVPKSARFLVLNVQRPPKGSEVLLREMDILNKGTMEKMRFDLWGCRSMNNPLAENHGPYRSEDLDRLCESATAGIVPSIWRETYGYVGAEMLSRGLPVIASSLGAMREYITDGEDGMLFDPFRPGHLASICRRLSEDDILLGRLRAGARQGWRKFGSFEKHVSRMEALYEEAQYDQQH